MFSRVLVDAALAVGVMVGAVTVLAMPGAALAWLVFGVVVAALLGTRLRDIDPSRYLAGDR